eukprot:s924_g7.t1
MNRKERWSARSELLFCLKCGISCFFGNAGLCSRRCYWTRWEVCSAVCLGSAPRFARRCQLAIDASALEVVERAVLQNASFVSLEC